jgi:hypothetical protein
MKRFENGTALAKEFGLAPAVLKKTFEDYNTSVRTKKDPFGKKVSHLLQFFLFQSHASLFRSSSRENGPSTTFSMSLS